MSETDPNPDHLDRQMDSAGTWMGIGGDRTMNVLDPRKAAEVARSAVAAAEERERARCKAIVDAIGPAELAADPEAVWRGVWLDIDLGKIPAALAAVPSTPNPESEGR